MPVVEQVYEEVAIDSIEPHPENYREHDDATLDESVGELGFYGAVLVQKSTRRILVGEGRWKALQRDGSDVCPVIIVDVDDEAARKMLLVDNRSHDLGGVNRDQVASLLRSVSEVGTLVGTGYDAADMQALTGGGESASSLMGIPQTETLSTSTGGKKGGGGQASSSYQDTPMSDRLDSYRDKGVRSLLLDYPLDEYDELTGMLPDLRAQHGVSSNSELIMILVRAAHAELS